LNSLSGPAMLFTSNDDNCYSGQKINPILDDRYRRTHGREWRIFLPCFPLSVKGLRWKHRSSAYAFRRLPAFLLFCSYFSSQNTVSLKSQRIKTPPVLSKWKWWYMFSVIVHGLGLFAVLLAPPPQPPPSHKRSISLFSSNCFCNVAQARSYRASAVLLQITNCQMCNSNAVRIEAPCIRAVTYVLLTLQQFTSKHSDNMCDLHNATELVRRLITLLL
jgi:hypothetical protein